MPGSQSDSRDVAKKLENWMRVLSLPSSYAFFAQSVFTISAHYYLGAWNRLQEIASSLTALLQKKFSSLGSLQQNCLLQWLYV